MRNDGESASLTAMFTYSPGSRFVATNSAGRFIIQKAKSSKGSKHRSLDSKRQKGDRSVGERLRQRANEKRNAARSKAVSSNNQKRTRKMPTCAVNNRMTEVTAKAPRMPQRMHSSREKGTEGGSPVKCAILLRTTSTMSHPDHAKRIKNTNSNARSIPVGVKSQGPPPSQQLPRLISALSIAESYHTLQLVQGGPFACRQCQRRTTLSGTDLLGAGSRTIAQPPRRFLVFVFQAGWLKPLLQAVSGSCAAFPALKSRVHCPP